MLLAEESGGQSAGEGRSDPQLPEERSAAAGLPVPVPAVLLPPLERQQVPGRDAVTAELRHGG